MKNTYFDLVDQTFDFPQDEFTLQDNCLHFHGIDLYALIKKYGTPLKITYLPKISQQIQAAKKYFNDAIDEFRNLSSYGGLVPWVFDHNLKVILRTHYFALRFDVEDFLINRIC